MFTFICLAKATMVVLGLATAALKFINELIQTKILLRQLEDTKLRSQALKRNLELAPAA
jgi:hypothetical protein